MRFLPVVLTAVVLSLNAQQDPVIQYNRSVGGVDYLFVSTDANGDIVAVGRSNNARLVVSANALQPRFAAGACGPILCDDVVVMKFRGSDGEMIAGTFLGGTGDDQPTALAVDAQGWIYIGGTTTSRNLPVNEGAFQKTNGSTGGTGFVAKIHPTLQAAAFSTYLGGNAPTRITAIAPDVLGSVFVAGATDARDFPVTPNAIFKTGGTSMGFVSRINNGGGLMASTFLGTGTPAAMALDSAGNPVIVGTSSGAWPVTTNAYQATRSGGADAFLTRVFNNAAGLIYSSYVGGTANDQGMAVAVDSANNIYVGGITYSAAFPATSQVLGEVGTGFVLKFTDTMPVWTQPIRANGITSVNSLQMGGDGTVVATGTTNATHFPTTSGAYQRCAAPGAASSAFYARLAQDGALRYSTLLHENVTGERWATTLPGGDVITLNRPRSTVEQLPPSNLRRYVFSAVPSVRVGCVVSAGSYRTTGITPGMVVTLFGSGMGPADGVIPSLVDGKLPTSAGGVRVLFNGTPAPLLYVRQDQINAVVPFSLSGSSAQIRVEYGAIPISPLTMNVRTVEPGIFRLGSSEFGAILNEDSTVNTPMNPAPRGSVITFWATGMGPFETGYDDGSIVGSNYSPLRLPLRITVGGAAAEVLYAGSSPDMVAGVAQVNLRLAQNTRVSSRVPINITVGDTTLSEVAYVSVR